MSNIMGQIAYSRIEVMEELEKWTREDVEAAIHHQFLGSMNMVAEKIWENSKKDKEELMACHLKEAGYWLTARSVKRQLKEKPIISPFNFGIEVMNMGASISIVVEQNKPFAELVVDRTTVKCEIVGGFPDPTPLTAIDGDIRTNKFSPALIDVVNFCSSFCSMKKGTVVGVDPHVGGALLGLGKYFKNKEAHMQIATLCDAILKRYTYGVSFEGETISGLAFQHRLYNAFTTMKGSDFQKAVDLINENVIGGLKDPKIHGGTRVISTKLENGKGVIGVHPPNPPFPTVVDKADFDPKPIIVDGKKTLGSATLPQAYSAMKDARSYRGADRGERAGIARCTYCPINLTPEWAELSYQIAEIKRLPAMSFYLWFDPTAGPKMFNFLSALKLMKYEGRLYAPFNQALLNCCKPCKEDGKEFMFKDTLKVMVLEPEDLNAKLKLLIVDKREVTSVRSGTYVTLMGAQRDQTVRRIAILDKIGLSYVLYAPLTDLTKSAVSTVTMHNGIVMYTKGVELIGAEKWWYDINTNEDIAHMAWVIVIVNICRTHAMIFNKKISNWLPQFGIRPPIISIKDMRMLGKTDMIYATVLEDLEATYSDVDVLGKGKGKETLEKEEVMEEFDMFTDETSFS